MGRSGEEVRNQMKGSLVLFALRKDGKEAAWEKAREIFRGLSGDEIVELTKDWNKETLDGIAEKLTEDERFT